MSEKKSRGWSWLHNATKFHYFVDGRSLCGRWLCLFLPTEDLEDGKDEHPDNCKACSRAVKKMRAKEVGA